MKMLLTSVILAFAAIIQSANGITISIEEANAHSLTFDVEWGPVKSSVESWALAGSTPGLDWYVQAVDFPWAWGGGPVFFNILVTPNYSQFGVFSSVTFADDSSRQFGGVDSIFNNPPSSLTPTPDGFGAHVVYTSIEGALPVHVPDGGSSLALMCGAFLGLAGLRSRIAKASRGAERVENGTLVPKL